MSLANQISADVEHAGSHGPVLTDAIARVKPVEQPARSMTADNGRTTRA
jgi:hypothetical protein